MKFLIAKSVGLCGLLLSLSACSNIEGQSLLTNNSSDPTTHNVDRTPRESELYLKPDSNTVSYATSKAEISGNCFTSTYPSHGIRAMAGNTMLAVVDTMSTRSDNRGSCKNGRFNLVVQTAGVGSGGKISLVLDAYDANSNVKSYNNGTTVTIYY